MRDAAHGSPGGELRRPLRLRHLGHGAPSLDAERHGIASSVPDRAVELVHDRLRLGAGTEVRPPAVRPARGPLYHGLTLASHPDPDGAPRPQQLVRGVWNA